MLVAFLGGAHLGSLRCASLEKVTCIANNDAVLSEALVSGLRPKNLARNLVCVKRIRLLDHINIKKNARKRSFGSLCFGMERVISMRGSAFHIA